MKLLLAHGADSNLQGMHEATPLIFACVKNRDDCTMDPSILVLLLSAGADHSAKNDEGSTALITASYFNYKEGTTECRSYCEYPEHNWSNCASWSCHKWISIVISELLLEFGAQLSLSDLFGMTPLDYALDNNHHDVCQPSQYSTSCDREHRHQSTTNKTRTNTPTAQQLTQQCFHHTRSASICSRVSTLTSRYYQTPSS